MVDGSARLSVLPLVRLAISVDVEGETELEWRNRWKQRKMVMLFLGADVGQVDIGRRSIRDAVRVAG